MKILRSLFSAKQVGILYHYTSLANGYEIVDQNLLRGYSWPIKIFEPLPLWDDFDEPKNPANFGRIPAKYEMQVLNLKNRQAVKATSFTRDNYFHRKPMLHGVFATVRFTVDGDKISDNYKISPYSFSPHTPSRDLQKAGPLNASNLHSDVQNRYAADKWSWDEMEEVCFFPSNKDGIYNFLRYVKSIDLINNPQAESDYQEMNTTPEGAADNIKNRLNFYGLGSLPVKIIN